MISPSNMTALIYAGLDQGNQRLSRIGINSNEPDYIINKVCGALNLEQFMVTSASRKRDLSDARKIIVGLILELNPKITLRKVGQLLGDRDHSTISIIRDCYKDLQSDKAFQAKLIKVFSYV